MRIKSIEAYTIFDSRGNPTIEAEVLLEDGSCGRGVAPSGASTGQYEAHELRDGNPDKFNGRSVDKAISNVNTLIAPALMSVDVEDQARVDQIMIDLDGTPNKSKLGANATLAVSTGILAAVALAKGMPLYERIGNGKGVVLPFPEIQIFGGGAHAQWRTDVQDFLLIANGATSYEEALEMTSRVFIAAGEILKERDRYYGAADEGGYWPVFESHAQIFETFMESVERAGYLPGKMLR